MKKSFGGIVILLLAALTMPSYFAAAQARQEKNLSKEQEVDHKIQARRFTLLVRTVIPLRGRTRNVVTDNYLVKVTPDTVVTYLPYFGRAYVAPSDPSKGGIEFTSTKFGYSETKGKKGGWNILIKPEDVNDVRQLSFSISSDGHASLKIISNHRDPISFNGMIGEK